jgi:hypothetical protein
VILTMERVITPGWLTRSYENELTGEWAVYHQCVNCGEVVEGTSLQPGRDFLLEHTAERHKSESFHGELHRFRSAIHALHAYYGLAAFEWPDKDFMG